VNTHASAILVKVLRRRVSSKDIVVHCRFSTFMIALGPRPAVAPGQHWS
jgi:hypothetical protein